MERCDWSSDQHSRRRADGGVVDRTFLGRCRGLPHRDFLRWLTRTSGVGQVQCPPAADWPAPEVQYRGRNEKAETHALPRHQAGRGVSR